MLNQKLHCSSFQSKESRPAQCIIWIILKANKILRFSYERKTSYNIAVNIRWYNIYSTIYAIYNVYVLYSYLSSIILFFWHHRSTIKLILFISFLPLILSAKVQLFYTEDRSQQTKLSDVKNEHVQPYNGEATMKDLLPTSKGKMFSSKLYTLYSLI